MSELTVANFRCDCSTPTFKPNCDGRSLTAVNTGACKVKTEMAQVHISVGLCVSYV